jgi:D-alanine-D-alanine ligase
VGLQFVNAPKDWPSAVAEAFRYDSRILVEERIAGAEVTASILDGEALPLVEIRPKQGAYDYHHKYTAGATDYVCPAPLDAALTAAIQRFALEAFRAIEGRDYARIDFMVTKEGQPYLLEVNTLPGMTETSLLPKAALAAGFSYANLCQRMIDLALAH